MTTFIAQDIIGEAMNNKYDFATIGEDELTNKLVIFVSIS